MRRLLACTACLVAVSTANAAHVRWQTQAGVVEAGLRGVVTADLDGDGRDEAVFTAGPSYDAITLGVIAHGGGALALAQLLSVDYTLSGKIIPARVGDSDRILVGTDDYYGGRKLIEYGGLPLRELRRLSMTQWTRPLAVADIDGDGDLDILALVSPYSYYDTAVALLDYATGVPFWTDNASVIPTGAIAAQLDSDPSLEIIIAGTIGRVLDGATRLQEWSYPAGFQPQLFAGEFDGGTASREFAAMDTYAGGPLTLFRAAPYSPLRDTPQPSNYGLVAAVDDIDNDGLDEILHVGPNLGGGSIAYTPSTDTMRRFSQEDFSADGVASGNLTGAAGAELVLTSAQGWYDQTDAVRVVDTATNAVRLSVLQASGPYAALALGDVDADGRDEVVHALSQRASEPGFAHLLCSLDAASGERRGCIEQEGYPEVPTSAPLLGRFTATAGDDLAVIQGNVVTVFDGATNARLWQRTGISAQYNGIAAGAVMRFEADGFDDLVLLDYSGRVQVLDGGSGETLWTSVALGSGSELTLTVANVDTDPASELLISTDNALYAFDAQTRLLDWSYKPGLQVGRVVAWGSGAACRMGLYDPAGRFQALRCSDRSNVGDEREFPANANLLRVLDPAAEHFVAATAGRIVTIAADDSVREWASGLGTRLGNNNAGVVIALGGNHYDVIVGSDTTVVRVAIHPDLLFEDAFE